MAPLTTIRGFPTQPIQAWGAKQVRCEPEESEAVREIIREIQGYIFTRRIRIKDVFLDFDPLRCGRCTPQQFARGVNSVVPTLSCAQIRSLTEFYADPPRDMKPQVRHLDFIRAVDSVFGAFDLEKLPGAKVPKPGHCLKKHGEDIQVCDDEAAVEAVLRRLALLVKTRGVVFARCFQDAERSLDTSLLCPRFSGKVTEAQFCSHFPFTQDVSAYELNLLLQRYYNGDTDGINYIAMDKELTALVEESEDGGLQGMAVKPRPRGGSQVAVVAEELLERIKAAVSSRRLRLHGSFQEVDRCRRGLVTMGQVRTVFTILRLELDSKELETLHRLFNQEGLFNYREFCNRVLEVPLDGELSPIAAGPPYLQRHERVRQPMDPESEELLAEAELWIARRVEHRSINVKSHFLDFDPLRCSRVSRSQFLRIMDMLQLGLRASHLEILLEAYCDASGKEFSYLDLCNSLQKRAMDLGKQVVSWRRATPECSKYFTRKGKVIPFSARGRPSTR